MRTRLLGQLLLAAVVTWHATAAGAADIEVALTFDDLPGGRAEITAVLDTLQKRGWQGVPGFANGGQITADNHAEQQLQLWVQAGQRLGNHSFSHADLWAMSTEAFLADVRRNETVLEDATDELESWRIFRYPFLFEGRSAREYHDIRASLAAWRYAVVQVSIDPYDWAWDGAFNRCRRRGDAPGAQAAQAGFLEDALAQLRWADTTARGMFGRPIKHILLLHVRSLAAHTLNRLLDAYEAAGVRFISLEEALADAAYGIDAAAAGPVSGTWLRQLMRAYPSPDITPPPPHPMAAMDALCAESSFEVSIR